MSVLVIPWELEAFPMRPLVLSQHSTSGPQPLLKASTFGGRFSTHSAYGHFGREEEMLPGSARTRRTP